MLCGMVCVTGSTRWWTQQGSTKTVPAAGWWSDDSQRDVVTSRPRRRSGMEGVAHATCVVVAKAVQD